MYHLGALSMRLNPARLLAVACALVVLGGATAARAAVETDFDDDGVVNTVTLEWGARPYIRIASANSREPVVLPLKERVSSIVAIDVDHDGLTDLAATKRRGLLLFWRNHGNGRFTPWQRAARPRAPTHLSVTPPGPGFHSHQTPGRIEIEGVTGQDDHDDALATVRSLDRPTLTGSRLVFIRCVAPDDADSRTLGSRAPPSTFD
jgi:hypothetical protein